MVDFVREGFLGPALEFKRRYYCCIYTHTTSQILKHSGLEIATSLISS